MSNKLFMVFTINGSDPEVFFTYDERLAYEICKGGFANISHVESQLHKQQAMEYIELTSKDHECGFIDIKEFNDVERILFDRPEVYEDLFPRLSYATTVRKTSHLPMNQRRTVTTQSLRDEIDVFKVSVMKRLTQHRKDTQYLIERQLILPL